MTRPSMHDLNATEEFSQREDWDKLPGDSGADAPDQVRGIKRFWGKWPGVVAGPLDPEGRCRLLVSVPDVFGPNVTSWALPCLPYGGLSLGMYVVPMMGANVWVEFLHGNPDQPIWTGFWYGSMAQAPKTPALNVPGAPQIAVESLLKHAIVISDTPLPPLLPMGGILLRSGASLIALEPKGIRIVGVPAVAVNGAPSGDPATAALYIV